MPNDNDQTIAVALRGVLLKRPISLVGSLKGADLEGLTGSVTIKENLSAVLNDLTNDYGPGVGLLTQLLGDGLNNITLERLSFGYRSLQPKIAEMVLSVSVGKYQFHFMILKKFADKQTSAVGEANTQSAQSGYVGGLEITLDPELFNTGSLSGLISEIVVNDIGIYYADQALGNVDYYPGRQLNDFDSSSLDLPEPVTRNFTKGLNWSGGVKVGEIDLLDFPLRLEVEKAADDVDSGRQPQKAPKSRSEGEQNSEPEGSPVLWMKADKTIGPLRFKRIGLTMTSQGNESRVGVIFDAAITVSGLTLGLNGLSVSLPISTPIKPKFDLVGLNLFYDAGSLQITGSFLRVRRAGKPDQFDGMAMIKAASFTITGFGSYTTVGGDPSMFIFAILHKQMGGPPFFRVNGLAAGFGYNRTLRLPPIEEIHNFPLVRAALDENFIKKDKPEDSIQDAMAMLRDYISPSSGDYWFAAGVRFSSFEMIQSFAMLSVSFGHEVVIALLGMSKMSVPLNARSGEAVAYAELAIKAVFRPEEGSIAVEGRLTDESYIFSKDCKLTGGFAFYTWLTGPHAGDFVVTLGGYHPKFKRPEHYPVVPRLGINWRVTSQLTITGEEYYALTPSCLMAGGRLSAVYNSGSIKACFIAYADFLISWQPFYYDIGMGVRIGVAASLRISLGFVKVSISIRVELSVQLRIWGPEFAGAVEVDLSVISFTICFGPSRTQPAPLSAPEFIEAFLPKPVPGAKSEPISVIINNGLIRQEVLDDANKTELRVVNAHALSLSAESLVPLTGFAGIVDEQVVARSELGIRPMGKTKLESSFKVDLYTGSDKAGYTKLTRPENIELTVVETGVPLALWGKSDIENKVPKLDVSMADKLIIQATVGIRISFAPKDPKGALPAMPIKAFAYETFKKPIPWRDDLKNAETIPAEKRADINTLMSESVIKQRNEILDALASKSPFTLNTVDLSNLAKSTDHYFQADPEICQLGEAFR